jgi:hypothetical protein
MSLNAADIYGAMSHTGVALQPTSVGGPNQGSVAPATEPAPSSSAGGSDPAVAFSWIGFVLLLIAWRVLIHLQGKG